MDAMSELINDRSTILSVVSEHYFLSRQEKKEMEFARFNNHPCSTPKNTIQHGAWIFCYHRDTGVLYIK